MPLCSSYQPPLPADRQSMRSQIASVQNRLFPKSYESQSHSGGVAWQLISNEWPLSCFPTEGFLCQETKAVRITLVVVDSQFQNSVALQRNLLPDVASSRGLPKPPQRPAE